MSHYINKLIEQGEHQKLDFKFEITDSRKIARSLVAFSNTDGGKLLIGVKDNGTIAGIRSDEEMHMVETAAHMFCKPEVKFETREWQIEGKNILEVTIPKRKTSEPYYSKNKEGKWRVYIRVDDKNLLANRTLLRVWKRKNKKTGVRIKYTETEKLLLDYLYKHMYITLSKYSKIAKISRYRAETILVNFILLDIIDIVFTEKAVYYKLSANNNNN